MLAPYQAFLDQRGEDYDDCPDVMRLVTYFPLLCSLTSLLSFQPVTASAKSQVQRAVECERDSGQRAEKPVLQAQATEEVSPTHSLVGSNLSASSQTLLCI